MKDTITIEIELPADATLFQLAELCRQAGYTLKISVEKQQQQFKPNEPTLRLTGVAA